MNLIGPKWIASKLHLAVKVLFWVADSECSDLGNRFTFFLLLLALCVVCCPKWPTGILLRYVARHRSEMVDLGYGAGFTNLSFGGSLPADANPGTRWSRRTVSPQNTNRLRMMGCAVVAGSLLRTVFCAKLLNMGSVVESGRMTSPGRSISTRSLWESC